MTSKLEKVKGAMGETLIPGSSSVTARHVISSELIGKMAAAAISAHESALAEEGMVIVKREEAIPPALAAARFDQAKSIALPPKESA